MKKEDEEEIYFSAFIVPSTMNKRLVAMNGNAIADHNLLRKFDGLLQTLGLKFFPLPSAHCLYSIIKYNNRTLI